MTPYCKPISKFNFKSIRKAVSLIVLVAFLCTSIQRPSFAQSVGSVLPWMPTPGTRVNLSQGFTPAHLKGMVIHPDNALQFDFIMHRGDEQLTDEEKKAEYNKLIKYFLASLAVPDEDQWVNLSPYEKDRIIKDDFGKTEMGRDLLAQDYILKQITASMIYPESNLGQKFWDKIYTQAQQQYGTTQVPVNTFNKVWIVPDEAYIYEKENTVYIVKQHLKVMLEEDYLSLDKHAGITSKKAGQADEVNKIGNQVVREIVLPALEKEVNEGKNFASLRQIYSGALLAEWYKRALKQSLLGKIYADKSKVKGIDQDPKANQEIYMQYLKAFKKGVFNYIKEDVDRYSKETIPRKYFSGGSKLTTPDEAMHSASENMFRLDAAQSTLDAASVAIKLATTSNMSKEEALRNDLKNIEPYILELQKWAADQRVYVKKGIDDGRVMAIQDLEQEIYDRYPFIKSPRELAKKIITFPSLPVTLDTLSREFWKFSVKDAAMTDTEVVDEFGQSGDKPAVLSVVQKKTWDAMTPQEEIPQMKPHTTAVFNYLKKALLDPDNNNVYIAGVRQNAVIGSPNIVVRNLISENPITIPLDNIKSDHSLIIDNLDIVKLAFDSPRPLIVYHIIDNKYLSIVIMKKKEGTQNVEYINILVGIEKSGDVNGFIKYLEEDSSVLYWFLNNKANPQITAIINPYLRLGDTWSPVALKNIRRDLSKIKEEISIERAHSGVSGVSRLESDQQPVNVPVKTFVLGSKDRISDYVGELKTDLELNQDFYETGFFMKALEFEMLRIRMDKEDEIDRTEAKRFIDTLRAIKDELDNVQVKSLDGKKDLSLIEALNELNQLLLKDRTIDKTDFDKRVDQLSLIALFDPRLAIFAEIFNDNAFKGKVNLKGSTTEVDPNRKLLPQVVERALLPVKVSQELNPRDYPKNENTVNFLIRLHRAIKNTKIIDNSDKEFDNFSAAMTSLGLKTVLLTALSALVISGRAIFNNLQKRRIVEGFEEVIKSIEATDGANPAALRDRFIKIEDLNKIWIKSNQEEIINALIIAYLENYKSQSSEEDYNKIYGNLKSSYISQKYEDVFTASERVYLGVQSVTPKPNKKGISTLSTNKIIEEGLKKARDAGLPVNLIEKIEKRLGNDSNPKSSPAMIDSQNNLGGIDLNSANLNLFIKRDGKGVPLPFSQQDLTQLNRIEGLVPMILEIRPAATLPMFSELQDKFKTAPISTT